MAGTYVFKRANYVQMRTYIHAVRVDEGVDIPAGNIFVDEGGWADVVRDREEHFPHKIRRHERIRKARKNLWPSGGIKKTFKKHNKV